MKLKQRNVWLWVAALLLCTTLLASFGTLYYYSQASFYRSSYESLNSELGSLTIRVNLKLDYNNGTVKWHNETRVPLEASLLTASKTVMKMSYQISDMGAFVNEINGVSGDSHHYWSWSYYDKDRGAWLPGEVGSDKWVLHSGDAVSWTFIEF